MRPTFTPPVFSSLFLYFSHHFHRLWAVAQQQGASAKEMLNVLVLRKQNVNISVLVKRNKQKRPPRQTR